MKLQIPRNNFHHRLIPCDHYRPYGLHNFFALLRFLHRNTLDSYLLQGNPLLQNARASNGSKAQGEIQISKLKKKGHNLNKPSRSVKKKASSSTTEPLTPNSSYSRHMILAPALLSSTQMAHLSSRNCSPSCAPNTPPSASAKSSHLLSIRTHSGNSRAIGIAIKMTCIPCPLAASVCRPL